MAPPAIRRAGAASGTGEERTMPERICTSAGDARLGAPSDNRLGTWRVSERRIGVD